LLCTSIMVMSPYHYDGYLDATSVENRIWVTGLELVGVMSTIQGCCPVQCWKHVVSYHTQI
jgi:hypothetical protein